MAWWDYKAEDLIHVYPSQIEGGTSTIYNLLHLFKGVTLDTRGEGYPLIIIIARLDDVDKQLIRELLIEAQRRQ